MTETSYTRISFIDMKGRLVVFDRRGHCAACRDCLVNRQDGRCLSGGPFDHLLRVNPQAFVQKKGPGG